MKINRYQFYLLLFFAIFLSADIAFIFIAKNIYSNNNLKISNQLSNFLQISSEPTSEKNIFNLLIKFNKIFLMKRVAVQLYNLEDKKIIDSFVYNNSKDNYYKLKVNSLESKRLILRVNFNDANKKYFATYRVVLCKNKYEITQIN